MSWDIVVQDLPPDARTVRDIPDHFKPSSIGTRSVLIQQIRDIAPSADFIDPAWGRLDTPTFSVEFSLGTEEQVRSFALHVRGDDTAAAFVSDLLAHLGYRALDPQSDSGLFEPGRVAEASMRRWREYRNRVVP